MAELAQDQNEASFFFFLSRNLHLNEFGHLCRFPSSNASPPPPLLPSLSAVPRHWPFLSGGKLAGLCSVPHWVPLLTPASRGETEGVGGVLGVHCSSQLENTHTLTHTPDCQCPRHFKELTKRGAVTYIQDTSRRLSSAECCIRISANNFKSPCFYLYHLTATVTNSGRDRGSENGVHKHFVYEASVAISKGMIENPDHVRLPASHPWMDDLDITKIS